MSVLARLLLLVVFVFSFVHAHDGPTEGEDSNDPTRFERAVARLVEQTRLAIGPVSPGALVLAYKFFLTRVDRTPLGGTIVSFRNQARWPAVLQQPFAVDETEAAWVFRWEKAWAFARGATSIEDVRVRREGQGLTVSWSEVRAGGEKKRMRSLPLARDRLASLFVRLLREIEDLPISIPLSPASRGVDRSLASAF